ncbi:HAD-superfamily hydrolase [Gracilibacillus halophilus YIM-C55.5]|uniref:HAD-superfamily hydrolase n=1 Tax=Gracilibacillus halophilus YIM-C55.5 TaxID=1308866 RepID=N4WRH7_9BACI|nr:HAD family hydrolase [Gracilibacillus halophilus]ENH97005.1 HAD-superfamily hydrolase [Gracilibacillus halophilus YIM-C55.5]
MIFFDIDGTLLNHEQAEHLAAKQFYHQHVQALEYSEDRFLKLWPQLSHKYFTHFLNHQLSFQQQRRMRMKDLFSYDISDEKADCLFNKYLSLYKRNWKMFDDVMNCLEQLKQHGHRLGIISNGAYEQQVDKLQTIGIETFFELIITSDQVGVSKPNARIFEHACRKAQVKASYCYYIGDQLESDAIASQSAGFKGIWINRKPNEHQTNLPVIGHLQKLMPIILG